MPNNQPAFSTENQNIYWATEQRSKYLMKKKKGKEEEEEDGSP
jgi:hypothetical protein